MDKPLIWLGASRTALKNFLTTRDRLLDFSCVVFNRAEPNDWKPMTAVGGGVKEIRIHTGVNIECFTWRRLRKESMFCTPSRSARRRSPNGMLNWRASVFAR